MSTRPTANTMMTEPITHTCEGCGRPVSEERYDAETCIALCEDCDEADRRHAERVAALLA